MARKREVIDPVNPEVQALLISGAVSSISWWSAFALGTLRELNFKVDAHEILALYILLVAMAWVCISQVLPMLFKAPLPHKRMA
jgi:hypothetical protein